MLKEVGELTGVFFQRSIRPEGVNGDPVLIIFSDGSINAYGAVAYLRWKRNDGYVSRLVTTKDGSPGNSGYCQD